MFMGISFFRVGKFSSIILLKLFTVPLSWESLLSSIPIIQVSWISWTFWVRPFLLFAFSYIVVSMFSIISPMAFCLVSFFCGDGDREERLFQKPSNFLILNVESVAQTTDIHIDS